MSDIDDTEMTEGRSASLIEPFSAIGLGHEWLGYWRYDRDFHAKISASLGSDTAKDLREHLNTLQSGEALSGDDLQDIQAIGHRGYYSRQDLNPETKYIKELLTDFTKLSEEDQITWRDKLSYFLGEHEDAWPLDGVMASWNGCDPFADVSLVDFELDRSVEGKTPERMEEEKDTDDGDEGLDQEEENKEEQADEGEGEPKADEPERDNEVPDEEGDTANNIPSIALDTAEEDLADDYVPQGGTSLFGGDDHASNGYLLSRDASPARSNSPGSWIRNPLSRLSSRFGSRRGSQDSRGGE